MPDVFLEVHAVGALVFQLEDVRDIGPNSCDTAWQLANQSSLDPPTALCTRILRVRCDATHRTGLRKDLMLVFGDPCFCGLFGLARVEPFCYPILQQGKETSLPTSARVDRAVASGVTETCIVGLSTLQGLMFRVRVSRFRV